VKLGSLVVLGSMIASGAFVACSSNSGGSPDPVGSGSAPKKGSAGGFSASLSADLGGDPAAGSAPAPPPPPPVTGSGSSGSAMAMTGSAGSATMAGSGKGSAIADASGSGKGSATATMAAGSGAGSAKGSGSGSAVKVAMTGSGAGSATPVTNAVPPPTGKIIPTSTGGGPTRPADNRHHVNPPADLAAIKIDLEPNWDRDFDEAGTISFVLKVPNTNDTRLFSFKYGYDLTGAPSDREAYKKFLADQKVLTVTVDRQRGAAWYLEGTDGTGAPAFRNLVVYGGKRLICGGSLYKDKDSTALGPDLRDKVVAAAKKICETMQL
jgi:hypothetical protein